MLVVVALIGSTIACKKNETKEEPIAPNYAEMILGTWLSSEVEDVEVLTDKKFVCQFSSDMVEMYAEGIRLDENNSMWTENANNSYRLEGNILIIEVTNLDGSTLNIETEISFPDENTLHCIDKKSTLNGESQKLWVYTMKKASADHKNAILGTWMFNTMDKYATYNEDGSYTFYRNVDSTWNVSDGTYKLYGDLLVTEWISAPDQHRMYDCWMITSLDENSMTWEGKRETETELRELQRVDNPPKAN